jgi:hypothetical protein
MQSSNACSLCELTPRAYPELSLARKEYVMHQLETILDPGAFNRPGCRLGESMLRIACRTLKEFLSGAFIFDGPTQSLG